MISIDTHKKKDYNRIVTKYQEEEDERLKEKSSSTCGSSSAGDFRCYWLPGTVNADKVIAKVDDTEITMGLLNFYVRYQQGVYETNYAQMMGGIDAMWSAEVGEGKTYEQSMKETSVELLKQMCVLEDHMDEYEITLTEAEKEKIKKAAEEFVKANKEEDLEAVSGDEETVERLLTLMTEQKKMHDAITAKADTEVSDDEARCKGMQYVLFSFTKTKDDGTTET